jgi:AcrR family transcriptional regulator
MHEARAILYRHFPSGNDLLAAAFQSLIPPAPMPLAEGTLRDRLIALVLAHAESIAEAPITLTAELGTIDRSRAVALLIGPLVMGRLSTLPDCRECARAAVDGFLHVQRAQKAEITSASNESAGV